MNKIINQKSLNNNFNYTNNNGVCIIIMRLIRKDNKSKEDGMQQS